MEVTLFVFTTDDGIGVASMYADYGFDPELIADICAADATEN